MGKNKGANSEFEKLNARSTHEAVKVGKTKRDDTISARSPTNVKNVLARKEARVRMVNF